MRSYVETLEYMKQFENKVFTLEDTTSEKFNNNKFHISTDGHGDDFLVLVLDEIGWVESFLTFTDLLRGVYTIKDIVGILNFEEDPVEPEVNEVEADYNLSKIEAAIKYWEIDPFDEIWMKQEYIQNSKIAVTALKEKLKREKGEE